MKNILLCLALVFFASALRGEDTAAPLLVHEWGTFTSLQDEQGNAIAGINTDDEPVPDFVHKLAGYLLVPQPSSASDLARNYPKGIPFHCHPDVTMRLETPVIYFYPPDGWKPQPVDVHVAFPGGWLSEFYPEATFSAPGFNRTSASNAFGHIRKDAAGELTWSGLRLGIPGTGPQTTEPVWLAPRDVKSGRVLAMSGESEKFLFYRGVGNVDSPLHIVRNTGGELEVHYIPSTSASAQVSPDFGIHAAWLVDVQPGGACAFKSLGALKAGNEICATTPGSFGANEYSTANMAVLRAEMRAALVDGGLFADEADALLNTWQLSYFKSPGLRFFYICPRAQVDATLPLQISVPSSVSRVMIGRIEIVTPQQRALLREIAAGPGTVGKFFQGLVPFESWKNTTAKEDYFALGRFRNALVLDEQKRRPTDALNAFIATYSLGAYKVD